MKEKQMREMPAFSAEAPRYTLLLSVFSCFFSFLWVIILVFAFGLLAPFAAAFVLLVALVFAFGLRAALVFAFGLLAALAFAFGVLAALAFAFGLWAALACARPLALVGFAFGSFGASATDLLGIMLENEMHILRFRLTEYGTAVASTHLGLDKT